MAGIQKIRLSQIASNMEGVLNFEEQLAKMRSSYEEKFIASNGQTSITLSREYAVGNNQLSVYLNGMRLSLGDDYTETNSRIITFSEPLLAGDIVLVRIAGDINVVVRNKPGLFEISRESFVITAQNEGQVEFTTSKSFGIGTNRLEVYRDGMLLECGADKDYVELTDNSFRLNYTVPTGTVITTKIYEW